MESDKLKDFWIRCCSSPNVEKKNNYGMHLYIHHFHQMIWFCLSDLSKTLSIQGHTQKLTDEEYIECENAFKKDEATVENLINYIHGITR